MVNQRKHARLYFLCFYHHKRLTRREQDLNLNGLDLNGFDLNGRWNYIVMLLNEVVLGIIYLVFTK